ncbi:hypothetical protein MCOR25_007958 [Pyricularia grisea]|uniref:Uncharacterized protein n=1 Tax=Pyricularia grisea TaxID=148305 RepID=A0A6P8B097_PYRGI|nr:uncharacterized protein PgNI_07426 [Pyricularia grisea]KAI6356118.1 hypothetical protein MCOR25_007958 [Pyricularia grisea]TLD08246.1 hypothetical protein PgNI_07426 [Pyricularia grisea]
MYAETDDVGVSTTPTVAMGISPSAARVYRARCAAQADTTCQVTCDWGRDSHVAKRQDQAQPPVSQIMKIISVSGNEKLLNSLAVNMGLL